MDRDTSLDHYSPTLAPGNDVLSHLIPARDLPEFHQLQERNQTRIQLLLQVFAIIAEAPTIQLGLAKAAGAPGIAGMRGMSAKNLNRLYSAWRKSRDWRALVDQALENKPTAAMPAEFVEELNRRADRNGRSIEQALKGIRRDWIMGEHIPGFGTWKDWWKRTKPGRPLPAVAPEPPTGWTTRNLRRYLDTSKFRRLSATRGRAAAAMHRPMVMTTRVGCWVGSHYMFDDVWHDRFVNSFAEKKAGRPLELFSHDYFSARKVRWGLRVRTEDDSGKAHGLTGRMMRMIVAATFYLDGYSPRGTACVLEHGTAAMSEDIEAMLYDASGGLIRCERSGMHGKAAHFGQYDGRAAGNPRMKASLESSNNLLHNLEAELGQGATGPDRVRRPEELHGLLAYNERLLAAYAQLPEEHARLLSFPLLEVGQYMQVLSRLYEIMENDPDHSLEGWIECGNVVNEVQFLGAWHNPLLLGDGEREMALTLAQAGKLASRPRKMSRREVWDMGSPDLVKVPGGVVCKLLGDDFAAERRVRSHQFAFEDKEVGPGEHRFDAVILDAEGRRVPLKDGETYKAFVNPFAADQLFVQDAKGRFLGIAPRIQRASRADLEAVQRAMGAAKARETELLEPLRRRHLKDARAKQAMHERNALVISGARFEADAEQAKAATLLAASPTPAHAEDEGVNW